MWTLTLLYILLYKPFQGFLLCAGPVSPRRWQAWIPLYILLNIKDGTAHTADTSHISSDIGGKGLL